MNTVLGLLALLLLALAAPAAAAEPNQRAPGKIIRLNGFDLHYRELGSGPPLLLLHGFGMCGEGDWGKIAVQLAKTNRVILVDLRGHGRSTNPSNAFTMRQSAEDIRALLDHLGIARVRAMGISAGGMTLLHLATKYPDRVGAMAVIGATTHFPEQARKIMRVSVANALPKEVLETFRQCAARGDGQVDALMRQFNGFKASYEDMNLTPPYLATIKARTLIVHGDRDEFFPVSIPVEMYAGIPRSKLWIVPGGDHVPIYGDRMPEFLRVARAFLADSDRPAPDAR